MSMTTTSPSIADPEPQDDAARGNKIQALRDMIGSAERTIQSAKAMLLQIEGKKKTGRPRKTDDSEGTVIEGMFDGQIMLGTDGKQYPIPANYASKSKLVEGDHLKLTITPDGSFVYKQIGPTERKHGIGVVTQDEYGNYYVVTEGKPYRILLASVTYFRAEPGDEAAIVTPRDIDSSWAALESVLQKHAQLDVAIVTKQDTAKNIDHWKKALQEDGNRISHTEADSVLKSKTVTTPTPEMNEGVTTEAPTPDMTTPSLDDSFKPKPAATKTHSSSLIDTWVRDMEEIEREIRAQEEQKQRQP